VVVALNPRIRCTHVAMVAPNFRDHRIYLVPLLRVLRARGPSEPDAIYDKVADLVGVTTEERAIRGSRVTDNPVYRNRIQFARQSLVDAGVLIGSSETNWRRGIWELSPAGIAAADSGKSDEALDEWLRRKAAEGARKRSELRKASRQLAGLDDESEASDGDEDASEGDDSLDEDDDVEGQIRDLVDSSNDAVLGTMLDRVRGMNETAFEYLVGTVLRASLRAESVTVTQRSQDGGIDGSLTFDALGMRIAVFQAKRYGEGSTVGRPEVDAFATAARRKRAAHALFVTSSRFSNPAIEAARDENIRLIDGMAFVELMAKHGIGLRAREAFVLYELDPAWSLETQGSDV